MNAPIIIAIALIAVLAVIALVGSARRRDSSRATGELSRESRRRDASARSSKGEATPVGVAALTGAEVERAAVLSRTGDVVVPGSSTPTQWVPPDPGAYDVTRRHFLNVSIISLLSFGVAAFGVAIVGFLWPTGSGGFGSKLRVGRIADIKAEIESNDGFLYKPEGRMWLVEYPQAALPKARVAYAGLPSLSGMEAGVVALYQKCPHLGCRVPSCVSSQWFECPCHGSQYNKVGEKKGGPAPRGMDRFATDVAADGTLTVDTGTIIQGPPIGTNTTGQEAEGPNCISGASAH